MNPVLYIVIDIVLFLITLFIIIFYRQLDRKDRQIHLVKALMENMQYELDEKFHKMRTTVEAMEDSIQEHEIGVESLLKRIDSSLGDLDKHAEDLQKLQSYMSHYHRILNELEELTVKAEKRLQKLEPEIAELESAGVKVDAWIGEAEQIRELLAAARKEIAQYTDEESRRQAEELRRRTEIIGAELAENITADMHSRAEALLAEVTAAMEQRARQVKVSRDESEPLPEQVEKEEAMPETFDTAGSEVVPFTEEENPAPIGELQEPEEPATPQEPEIQSGQLFDEQEAVDSGAEADEEPEYADLEPDDDEDPDSEEIYFDDDDELSIDEAELAEIEEKLTKRDIVAKYAGEGLDSAAISEKTGIPRGEVELILELMDFTR